MGASYISPTAQKNINFAIRMNDMTDGWDAIVDKKTTYLPKQLSEDDNVYNTRHALATYLDSYNPTIDGLNGLIFQKPIEVETSQTQLQEFLDEATTDGKNFNKFVKDYFDTALRKDLAFAYVDIPQGNENARTDTQRRNMGIMPYVVMIEPENVINWKTDTINGKITLTQVTIKEIIEVDKDEFETETKVQYRVLRIGEYHVFNEDNEEITNGLTGLSKIPLAALQLNGKGFFEAKPPFNDLARLSIANYQLMSDSRWSANTASIPFLHFAGFDKEELEKLVISVNKGLRSENPDSSINYVDYEGKGVALNLTLMDKIDKRIAEIGMAVISDNKAEVTATEKTIDTIQTQSKLSNWVDSLKNSIQEILGYVMMYYGQEANAEITISADILDRGLTAEEMAKYSDMVAKGQLTNETLWTILKQKGRLPEDFDADLERERLQEADAEMILGSTVSNI